MSAKGRVMYNSDYEDSAGTGMSFTRGRGGGRAAAAAHRAHRGGLLTSAAIGSCCDGKGVGGGRVAKSLQAKTIHGKLAGMTAHARAAQGG
jgi:hypothetical protein